MSSSNRPGPTGPSLLAGVVLTLVVTACGGGDQADDAAAAAAAADSAAAMAAPPPKPPITDAQIAHVAVTANAIDSAAGVMARGKARSRAVRDFARTMVRDHGAVNAQAVTLATRLNVTPEANDISQDLQAGADQARTAMEGLSGAEFDRAYIDREVAYHQAVLDALDNTLIPGTQNAELKQLLESARPNFAAHLELAKQVQAGLGTN